MFLNSESILNQARHGKVRIKEYANMEFLKSIITEDAIPEFEVITVNCYAMQPKDFQIHRFMTATNDVVPDDTNITSVLTRNGDKKKLVLLEHFNVASDRVRELFNVIIDNSEQKELGIHFVITTEPPTGFGYPLSTQLNSCIDF